MKRMISILFGLMLSAHSVASEEPVFLPVEEAFPFSYSVTDSNIVVQFDTAEEYYLYHKRFSVSSSEGELQLQAAQYSQMGKMKDDPNFGTVKVYEEPLTVTIPYHGEGEAVIRYQGCADAGLCYLPQSQSINISSDQSALLIANVNHSEQSSLPEEKALPKLSLPKLNLAKLEQGEELNDAEGSAVEDATDNQVFDNQASDNKAVSTASLSTVSLANTFSSDSDGLSDYLNQASLLQALVIFFVLGVGLSLTPCILPMIPILSSIIGGQGETASGWKGFRLALAYVLGMASSYALIGILTASAGQGINLQAAMQQTWVLSLFAVLFAGLALSMFGLYELQLPSRFQVAINNQSQRFSGGKSLAVFAMGAVSALVVSPCVSAPLAGTLLYVSTTQDWLLGGSALFVLALGMGIPLLVIGATGGRFLPRTGPWMVAVKTLFGIMLLGVAIALVSRFAPSAITLGLWSALIIGSAVHFGALEAAQPGWERVKKSAAFIGLAFGVMLLLGAFTGASDPLDPLSELTSRSGSQPEYIANPFTTVERIDLVKQSIKSAGDQNKITMIDLYADWCASCQVMEKEVFHTEPVMKALQSYQAIQLDLTENGDDQKKWLAENQLFGPPAVLFFDTEGQELRGLRLTGEVTQAQLLNQLEKVQQG